MDQKTKYTRFPYTWRLLWNGRKQKWTRFVRFSMWATLLLILPLVSWKLLDGKGNEQIIKVKEAASALGQTLFTTTNASPSQFYDQRLYPKKVAVSFNPDALQHESSITLQAFGTTITILKTATNQHALYRSWYGQIQDVASSYFVLVNRGEFYSGIVGYEGASFALKGRKGSFSLAMINTFALPEEEATIESIQESIEMNNAVGKVPAIEEEPIDILVLYTPQAKMAAAKDLHVDLRDTFATRRAIETEIAQAIEIANFGYHYSQVPVRINLSNVAMIGNNERWETKGSLSTTLDKLRKDQQVRRMRDENAADLVSLFVEKGKDAGVAKYFHAYNPTGNRAFSVVRRDCASNNYSFAHELGHNLGLDHHCENSDRAGAGHGYYYRTSKGENVQTIMSKKRNWKRLPFYSDASIGTGTLVKSGDKRDCYSQEVEVLRTTAAVVAGYRTKTKIPEQNIPLANNGPSTDPVPQPSQSR